MGKVKTISTMYREGFKASDYVPIHRMLVMEYVDFDVLIQLIIYSPDNVPEESIYAWAIYVVENDRYKFKDLQTAVFNNMEELKDQKLPPKSEIGMHFYRKLTDGSIF